MLGDREAGQQQQPADSTFSTGFTVSRPAPTTARVEPNHGRQRAASDGEPGSFLRDETVVVTRNAELS